MGGDFVSKLTKGLKFKDQETQTCSSNKGQFKGHVNTHEVICYHHSLLTH